MKERIEFELKYSRKYLQNQHFEGRIENLNPSESILSINSIQLANECQTGLNFHLVSRNPAKLLTFG